MLDLIAPSNLEVFAQRINAAHAAVETGMRDSLANAIEAGQLLIEVKTQLGHGQWLPWLEGNFHGSHDMASRYMLLAKRAPEVEGNFAHVRNLSIRAAVKLLNKSANAGGTAVEPDQPLEPDAEPEALSSTTTDSLDKLVAAKLKFACIYADPPWRYGNQATRASTDNHYPTMTVQDIAALPVKDLAADRAHLWLWTTNGFLFECPKLFAAWGFEFKSSYVWVKQQIGIGNYLRNSHEFLLLATRGGMTGAAKNVKSWGEFPRTEHSAKPKSIRFDVVERVSPGPRLELFGREMVDGWTVWGNQIRRTMFDAVEAE